MNPNLSTPSRRSTVLGLGLVVAGGTWPAIRLRDAADHVVVTATESAVREGLASGASRVILPAGRIVLNRPLEIGTGTSLIGAGSERTVFEATVEIGAGQAMIDVVGTGVSLSDFAVNGRAQDSLGAGHGIQMSGSGHRLAGLVVRDVAQAGYRLSISDSRIENCAALDCGRRGHTDNHGFMLYRRSGDGLGPLRGTTFRNCRVENAFRKGFAVYTDGPEVSDIRLEGCAARGCGLPLRSGGGFYIVSARGAGMADVAVRDCQAEDNYVNFEIGPVTNLLLTGCRSRNAQATGILIHGSRNVQVIGNTDEGSGVDAMRFDNVLGRTVGGRVADNLLKNANRSASGFASFINLEGAEAIEISGNTYGDDDGRTPFGIYEGRPGRNDVMTNRRVDHR